MTPKEKDILKLLSKCRRVRVINQRVEGWDTKNLLKSVPNGKAALTSLAWHGNVVPCEIKRPMDTQWYEMATTAYAKVE